jgi:hypothetical protein
MSSKYTIATAVRMMGHLLESHPTEGALSRTKRGSRISPTEINAACWCYIGAGLVVSQTLKLPVSDVFRVSDEVSGIADAYTWDGLTKINRLKACKKLQEYKG